MMRKIWVSFAGLLALFMFLLAACNSTPTAETSTSAPSSAPEPASTPSNASLNPTTRRNTGAASGPAFEMESNSGGSVTVDVKPAALAIGKPVAFNIAMNTHSVDLSDDMTKIAILRDDTGKEYRPTTWDGPAGGGHHRSGTLTFPTLIDKPKYVELVIRGLARVPERVFRWELP